MKPFLLLLLPALALHSHVHAGCTYDDAQTKGIEVVNMLQVYNREQLSYIQRGEEAPASLHKKILKIDEEKNAIGIKLGQMAEAGEIDYEGEIDPEICLAYDRIMKKHAPASYQKAEVVHTYKEDLRCNSSDTNKLWERYGIAIEKESELYKTGKLSKQKGAKITELFTYFGQYSTTDPKKACQVMGEIEDKLTELSR